MAGLAMGLAALPDALRAEDEPPARTEVVSPPTAGSVTRITRDEIERRQWRTLADVLRAQPGVHLTQLGGRGQDAAIFFRGNPNGSVLIRMDGIDLSDPATRPVGAVSDAELRSAGQIVPDLLTENIEQIEILRGPQSARYGSDAIGGVIEIQTRRGQGAPSPWAAFEVGGFGTTQQSVGIAGGSEVAGYSFSYTNARTRGISSGPRNLGLHERDANENDTLSGRLDLELGDVVSFRTTGRWIDEDTQLDNVIDIPLRLGLGDDPQFLADNADRRPFGGERKRLYLGAETRVALLDERWVQTFGARFGDHDVDQDDEESVSQSDSMLIGGGIARIDIDQTLRQLERTERDGSRLGFDWSNELRLSPEHTLIFGLETERESVERVALAELALDATLRATLSGDTIPIAMQSIAIRQMARQRQSERLRNHAAFVGDVFRYERVFGEVALRLNDHDDYGSGFSYRLALGYQDPGSRLRVFASVGTGFRDPDVIPSADFVFVQNESRQSTPSDGLDQSFSTSFVDAGDRTLDRSVSRGFELGFELPLLEDRLTVGATAFTSRVRGLQTNEFSFVIFDPSGGFQITQPFPDSAQARIRGAELAVSWQASSWLRASADYTYTHAELAHVPATPGIFISEDIGRVRLVRPSGTDLTGVPKQRIHLLVEATPYEGVSLGFALRHVGERKDNFFTRSESLGGYTVYDVTASYRMNERVELFARVENLFDKEYNDLRLAEQPGIAGYLGVRARY